MRGVKEMNKAIFCVVILLFIPVAESLAQMGVRARPDTEQIAPAQDRRPREHKWVNPLPDSKHERVTHHTYHSEIMDVDIGYGIYLPPGYEDTANSNQRYPVVYFLHGGFGNEARMLDPARVDMAGPINTRIQSGVVSPMIYVFPNGGKLPHYDHENSLAETSFVTELIPHIDQQYRTIAKRGGRGLEGFSSGGRGAARDMFKYPELFCSGIPLSGGHQQEKVAADNDGHLGGMMAGIVLETGNNSWDLAASYAAETDEPRVKILVAVGTDDMNYQANLDWMAHLESLGVPFERHIIDGIPHDPELIYENVGDEIMQFHASCFAAAQE
jgi:enterochelin esterase-like enzyme